MNAVQRCATALAIGFLTAASAMAQDKAPDQPSGRPLTEADHRQNMQSVTTEWRSPASNIEGISTYSPDGTFIVSAKLPDGTLRHSVGVWRIDGEQFCQTMKTPPGARESCIRSYQTGDNAYQAWNVDGRFSAYWRIRK